MSTTTRPPNADETKVAALLLARLGGCSCSPDITPALRDGVWVCTVEHDLWCNHILNRQN